MYIAFAFAYAILNGCYKICNKKSVSISSTLAVLCLFTTTALICASSEIGAAILIDYHYLPLIILEGLLSSLAWLCATASLKKLEVSISALIQTFSTVLSFLGGIIIFQESVTPWQIVGAVIVFSSVILTSIIEIVTNKNNRKVALLPIILVIFSTFCSFGTSLINKYLLRRISAPQNQFWYLLTICLIMWSLVFILKMMKRPNPIHRSDFRNFWAYLTGIFLFIGDLCLYIAYHFTDSKLSVITIVSKFSMIVIFVISLFWLKEKRSLTKILLLGLVLTGIILVAIG